MRHRHRRPAAHPLGVAAREDPADDRAPVVAHQVERVASHRVGDREYVGYQVVDPIVLDTLGSRPRRVPALVGSDGPVAGGRQRLQLMTPLVRRLREAVQQQHELAVGRAGGTRVEHELADGNLDPLHAADARRPSGRL